MKEDGGSRVVLRMPSASSLSTRVGALSYDWTRACFAANVTAGDIPSTADASCEVKRGVFAGMVPPNGELSLMVKQGTGRRLELFVFQRSDPNQPCPTLTSGFGSLRRDRIARVGVVESFDVSGNETNVSVTVTAPAAGVSVLTQYGMSTATCLASSERAYGGRVLAGAGFDTNLNSFKIRQSVSFKEDKPVSSGNGYTLKGSLIVDGQ